MKGIILAGGTGSRLYPLTLATNKQLLPIYDKPVIYYPLTTLMLAGIRDILIISNASDMDGLKRLLGTGEHLGLSITYKIQERPNGLPEAFILGEDFINDEPVAMILGDNFFYGHGLSGVLTEAIQKSSPCHIFTHHVDDPSRYGIVVCDDAGRMVDIEEKPVHPKSHMAVTGLYFFDGSVSKRARELSPSPRGELEIVDLIRTYDPVSITHLGRGYVWFDAGTPQSLLAASHYVEVIQTRQGDYVACPEEVALRMGFIDKSILEKALFTMPTSKYSDYLKRVAHDYH